MKLWLAVAWLIGCIWLGINLYRRQWNQVRDYAGWVGFCEHLQQAIGFALQPLPQAVESYLPTCRGQCYTVLTGYLQLLKQKVDLTRARCSQLTADTMLAEFLYQLGRTSRETEKDKIMAAHAVFAEKAKLAKHDLQTKASIMLKLLIIIGIAGGILWM